VQPLRFGEHRVVLAPRIACWIGGVELRFCPTVGAGRDVVPVELDADRADAQRLHLRDHVRALGGVEQVG